MTTHGWSLWFDKPQALGSTHQDSPMTLPQGPRGTAIFHGFQKSREWNASCKATQYIRPTFASFLQVSDDQIKTHLGARPELYYSMRVAELGGMVALMGWSLKPLGAALGWLELKKGSMGSFGEGTWNNPNTSKQSVDQRGSTVDQQWLSRSHPFLRFFFPGISWR